MTAFRDETYDHPREREGTPARRQYRPPVGIPDPTGERRPWRGTVLSVVLHALILLLLLAPVLASDAVRDAITPGAGGPGPAGGGGGGSGGTGGLLREPRVRERLHYLQLAPPAPAAPVPTPKAAPPPVPPPKKPEVPQKKPVPPATPAPQAKTDVGAPTPDVSLAQGTGGGTGKDGTAGTGPGTGGGVGSGVGTGRGSGVGPGTGGGAGTIYPPSPTQFYLPPQPVPGKARPYNGIVVFDVDSTGKVLSFTFTPTKDGGYNKRLKETLDEVRFRPATRADGVPVRARAEIQIIF